ncbi:MAG: type II secretion system F family protein [Candidatus Rokuibacteriota bacterium]
MALLAAILAFVAPVTLVIGLWWVAERRRRVRERLQDAVEVSRERETRILRPDAGTERSGWARLGRHLPTHEWLAALLAASGTRRTPAEVVVAVGLSALGGGLLGWMRIGGLGWGLAVVTAPLPLIHLLYRRHRRVVRCEQQLPDALDMVARAIRTGYALTGAIQLVGEDGPDPIGTEFRRISEEIRLGMDPGEALLGIQQRLPTQDIEFFCTAIRIQRAAGGNLAEILDRLSEVIRERFKLLSHARALSAQHRWSAISVGLSPVGFALMFALQSPGYFDPLLASPLAPYLIGTAVVLEVVGFAMIWRIAQIKV